jgi:hypothetical protein
VFECIADYCKMILLFWSTPSLSFALSMYISCVIMGTITRVAVTVTPLSELSGLVVDATLF